MAITLPFSQPHQDTVHYSEDLTLSKCAVLVMNFIVANTKQGIYTTNTDIDLLSIRSTGQHSRPTYGNQSKSTAKKQLQSAGYIVADRIRRGAKGWRAVKEYRKISEIPDISRSPYDHLPQQAENRDFVYIFRRIRDGIYKIGVTGNLRSRANTIACGCGSHIDLIAALDTSDAYQIEQELHQCFDSKRLPGEWFELDISDVTRIKNFFSDMQNGGF